MKGKTILAVAVCAACFFIGYLTYLATALFVGIFIEQVAPCHDTIEVCTQQQRVPLK